MARAARPAPAEAPAAVSEERSSFQLTPKQTEALRLFAPRAVRYVMLFGGSRSGKTFLTIRTIVIRALAAVGSRHAVLRLRFSHVKNSIVRDTLPKVLSTCFPGVAYHLDKTDWYVKFGNGSEIWFGGLDDKDRTEKILGMEFSTIFLNECSQLSYHSYNIVKTRLAQKVLYYVDGHDTPLRRFLICDCNPPNQLHWTYQLFRRGIEPDTKAPVNLDAYASILMNPVDNRANLPEDYFETLDALPPRLRRRFRDGEFADMSENAYFTMEGIDANRVEEHPDLQRIVVAVDPSGAADDDNSSNDPIGIIIAGLGVDGRAYVLEDATVLAGPKVWGNVATTAYERHEGDVVVGEVNYGGEMVKFVIQAARPGTPFKKVTASRGKVVRAEPISYLVDEGKVRFVGHFNELEDELCGFTKNGFIGQGSPNRADALVWALTELFPGIAKRERQEARPKRASGSRVGSSTSWLGI